LRCTVCSAPPADLGAFVWGRSSKSITAGAVRGFDGEGWAHVSPVLTLLPQHCSHQWQKDMWSGPSNSIGGCMWLQAWLHQEPRVDSLTVTQNSHWKMKGRCGGRSPQLIALQISLLVCILTCKHSLKGPSAAALFTWMLWGPPANAHLTAQLSSSMK